MSNKNNIMYFEGSNMGDLFDKLNAWQLTNKKRFLSITTDKQPNGSIACIALSNPSEVIIVDPRDGYPARVTSNGSLLAKSSEY